MKRFNVYKLLVMCLVLITLISASVGIFADSRSADKLDTGLQYRVDTGEKGSKIKVFLKINDKSELEAYSSKVNTELTDIVKRYNRNEIPITLTFNKPLTISYFTNLVNEYDIKVKEFKIRFLDENNNRITMGGRPENGELVPIEKIEEMAQKYPTHVMKGIISVVGTIKVDEEKLESLKKSDSIYLIDASSILVVDQVMKDKKIDNIIYPKIPDVYWFVEDFNR